jgi:glycosyltransferase involved in cell wall biosynthesis
LTSIRHVDGPVLEFHLKILHLIVGLGGGGAEGALCRLCEHAPDTTSMTVISLTDEGIHAQRLRDAGVNVIALGMGSVRSLPRVLWRLWWILKAHKPDLVQTWMYHADLLGGLSGRLAGIPVCWGIRTSDVAGIGNPLTKFIARLCALSSGALPVHAVSCGQHAARHHRAFGYRVPITVVPNGYEFARWAAAADTRHARAAFSLTDGDIVFAHAARAHPQKDHPGLALAFSAAHAREPRLRLLLCGRGLEAGAPEFEMLPFSNEARSAVRALGARDDLPQLWGLADFFVLSSINEGFPNVVAEAMASGLPAVVTDAGDAALIVGDTGIVVPPSDPGALARAMLEMAAMSAPARRALGKAAAQRVRENYSVQRMVDGFHSVWREILDKAGR